MPFECSLPYEVTETALDKHPPHAKKSASSKRAAEDYTPRRAGSDAFAVLEFLNSRNNFGATDREIYEHFRETRPKLEGTYRRARNELVEGRRLPNGRGLVGELRSCPEHGVTASASTFSLFCGLCGSKQDPLERACDVTGSMQTVWAITPYGERFLKGVKNGR